MGKCIEIIVYETDQVIVFQGYFGLEIRLCGPTSKPYGRYSNMNLILHTSRSIFSLITFE